MFEFRLRILDVRERENDPPSFLGIVDGFPQVMAHAASTTEAERDLTAALGEHLARIQDREATRIDWDEFPTVRIIRLFLGEESG
jgi:predicted RNase H-like HicB family nuclease